MKQVLSKYENKIIGAIAEVIIPLSDKAEMVVLLERIDDHLKYMKPDIRFLYRLCLLTWEFLAFFYYGSFKTLTEMDLILRERYINAWHNTKWSVKRTIKRFIEAAIFMNYYGLPSVASKVCGYEPSFEKPLPGPDFPLTNLITEPQEKNIHEEADVCVIGSGAGGAVVAKELAEKGHSVVILEDGGFYTEKDFGDDVITMIKRLYYGGGLVNTFGWPPILLPVGRCVGGTTLINSGTCFRTPNEIFEKWAYQFGLNRWTSKVMEPHYDEVEKVVGVAYAKDSVQGKSAEFFSRGINCLGHNIKPLLRNAPKCCGSGVCCFGCPTNAKRSVQLNYVPLALTYGARLYTNCRATKIVYKHRHATHVLGQFRGSEIKVKAKIIICACGTLHTPVLLKHSHVPNVSGQIGHNLTLHPAAKVMALFDEKVCGWQGIPQGYYSDALINEGIRLEGIFLQPAFLASTLMLSGRAHREAMENYNYLALFGMMVSDTSRGRVFPGLTGGAVPFYNINRADLPKYKRGIQFLTDAFFKAGARKVFLPLHSLPVVTKEEGIKPIIELKLRNKDLDLQAFHPLGTCRMGAEPRESVLDPFARLYGLDNLFVADGSIFPTSLGVNPMMTIMAAAHKIAEQIDREFL